MSYTVDECRNMLEDVINQLNLSDCMIEKHGPLGTPPAELVGLVLKNKDNKINILESIAARIEELEGLTARQIKRTEELETAIRNFQSGDYPHPRSYRPQQCPHDKHYYEDCGECDAEYWETILPAAPE